MNPDRSTHGSQTCAAIVTFLVAIALIVATVVYAAHH